MAKLTADSIRMENGVEIREKIIPDSARASKDVAEWCKKGQPMKPLKAMRPVAVTIHNTTDLPGVEDAGEQYTRATWPNCNMGGVVVHYYVDDTGAWQNLREEEQGWHAGDGAGEGNAATVAIEIIMDGSGSGADKKAEDNGARLAAAVLRRWGLTAKELHSHYYYSPVKKNCPVYIRPHWETFAAAVAGYMEQAEKEPAASVFRVQVGAFRRREYAEAQLQKLLAAGFPAYIKEEKA